MTHAVPPGWYPDPEGFSQYRWWTGVNWTYHVYQPQMPVAAVRKVREPSKWIGRFGGLIIVGVAIGIWVWVVGISFLLNTITPPDTAHDNVVTFPATMLIAGSAGVATAFLYTMAYRLRPSDGLTPGRMLIIGAVGGLAAILVAGPLNSLVDILGGGSGPTPSAAALAGAGFIEEAVKILAVVVLAWKLPVKNARTGLFVGGAVGFAFSVFENIDYLQFALAHGAQTGNGLGLAIGTTLVREISGPFLHPAFTAILAAALFATSRNGRFRFSFTVVGVYLAVAVAHSLFDSMAGLMGLAFPGHPIAAGGLAFLLDLVLLAAVGTAWLLVARRANRVLIGADRGNG